MKKTKNYLPKNAKLVFKGELYEVYQWEQKMYDGTTKTFEKVKKANSVNVVALVDDKIIIQEQEQPHRDMFISLPGGRCEDNESEINTAKRELLEETGYMSDDFTLWKVTPSPFSSVIGEAHCFIAKNCYKVAEPNLDNGEKIRNKLVSFDEFIALYENELFRSKDILHEFLHLSLDKGLKQDFYKTLFA
jgi:ADP-ribose pyrophosphatase